MAFSAQQPVLVVTASGKVLPGIVEKRLTQGYADSDVYGVWTRLGVGTGNDRVYADHYAGSMRAALLVAHYLPYLSALDRIESSERRDQYLRLATASWSTLEAYNALAEARAEAESLGLT